MSQGDAVHVCMRGQSLGGAVHEKKDTHMGTGSPRLRQLMGGWMPLSVDAVTLWMLMRMHLWVAGLAKYGYRMLGGSEDMHHACHVCDGPGGCMHVRSRP